MESAGTSERHAIEWLPNGPALELLRDRDRVVPFLGAGIGHGAGLPDGASLARLLRDSEFASEIEFPEPDSCMAVAARISGALDHAAHRRFDNFVADLLRLENNEYRITDRLRSLVHVRSRLIITTNYDLLLEAAAEEEDIPCLSVVTDREGFQEATERARRRSRPDDPLLIVHLHGSVDRPETIVLDPRGYVEVSADQRVSGLLQRLFDNYTVCFMGFAFDEPYLITSFTEHLRTRAEHVLILDEAAVDKMRTRAAVTPEATGIETAAFPAGQFHLLDPVCSWISRSSPLESSGEALVSRAAQAPPTDYLPSTLMPPDEVRNPLSAAVSAHLGLITPVPAHHLAAKHRVAVRGLAGTGKSGLLRMLGHRVPADRHAVLLRAPDLPTEPSDTTDSLSRWATSGEHFGDPLQLGPGSLTSRSYCFLVDGLDEVGGDRQIDVVRAIRQIAEHFTNHDFLVVGRPVAALEELTGWEHFELAPDFRWRDKYLAQHGLAWSDLVDRVPELGALNELMARPFFVRALVDLEKADKLGFTTALGLVEALIERALEQLELRAIEAELRPWLTRVALGMQIFDRDRMSRSELEAVPLLAGDEASKRQSTLDLLVDRSLLEPTGDSYRFIHRLFGDALVAQALRDLDAESRAAMVDFIAPSPPEMESAVRAEWWLPLELLLPVSQPWRKSIRERDPLVAARGTPADGTREERQAAARLIWDTYVEREVWIHDRERETILEDSEVLGRLLRDEDLSEELDAVVSGLGTPSRQIRTNAIEVLSYANWAGLPARLLGVIYGDEDAVVRRLAYAAARRTKAYSLYGAIRSRALQPADDLEAQVVENAALELAPPAERVGLALQIAETSPHSSWGHGHAIDEHGTPRDRLRLLYTEAHRAGRRHHGGPSSRDILRLVPDLDPTDDTVAHEVAFVAAGRTANPEIATLLARHPRHAIAGFVEACMAGIARSYDAQALLSGVPTDLLVEAGVPEQVIAMFRQRDELASRPAIDVTDRVAELEAQAEAESTLAAFVRQSPEEAVDPLVNGRDKLREEVSALSEDERARLGDHLEYWWTQGLAGAHEVVMLAWLEFAEALELETAPERWVMIACTGIGRWERDWLRRRYTPALARQVAEKCQSDRLEVWAGILDAVPPPLPREVIDAMLARLTDVDDSGALDGTLDRLAEEGHVDAIASLSTLSETAAARARPFLARVGDLDAQTAMLRDSLEQLRGEGGSIDSDNMQWTAGINDASLLDLLFECLVASYNYVPRGHGSYNNSMGAFHAAIRAIGGMQALERYDALLRQNPRPFDGAQFLRKHRDEISDDLLTAESRSRTDDVAQLFDLPELA